MEHFITKIHVDQVRHLENIDIELSQDKRKHLILTGKNGSGKTSLLTAIKANLYAIHEDIQQGNVALRAAFDAELKRKDALEEDRPQSAEATSSLREQSKFVSDGVELCFSAEDDLGMLYSEEKFITAFFPADRLIKISTPHGVVDVRPRTTYSVADRPITDFAKYLVHLKTQQMYAQSEGDISIARNIDAWFLQLEQAIRELLDDDSISLKYEYKNYNFVIHQKGRNPCGFNQLSDGFSAAIYILADLLMRMDQSWLLNNTVLDKSLEGVVLIDEVDAHLHLELQKRILPFLTKMFPGLQFIVTTHSPFVVNSLEDAVIYDLDNKTLVTGGLSRVSYEGIVEGYFRADALSVTLRNKFERYKCLVRKSPLSDDDYDEIMTLQQYLDGIPDYLSIGIAEEYGRLKLEFQNREEA